MNIVNNTQTGKGAGPAERYPSLDVLRGFCMFFVIFYHGLLAFSSFGWWFVKTSESSDVFSYLIWLTTGFSMKVFFVLSGFLGGQFVQRKGASDFLQNRALRIFVPLLICVPLFNLFSVSYTVDFAPGEFWSAFASEFRLHYFWFIYYLLLITIFTTLLHSLITSKFPRVVDSFVSFTSSHKNVYLMLFIMMVITSGCIWLSNGLGSGMSDPSTVIAPMDLYPIDLGTCLFYTVFYVFGWWLGQNTWFLQTITKYWAVCLTLGLTLRFGSFLLLEQPNTEAFFAPADQWAPATVFVLDVLSSTYSWFVMFGLIGMFVKHITVDRSRYRYLADSAYWCYIAHMPILLFMQTLFTTVSLPVAAMYFVALIVTLGFCFTSYHLFVRFTPIGTLLNGPRRKPRPA